MRRLRTSVRRHGDRGHTLVELVLSVAVLSIVMASVMSVMLIAVRAVHQGPAQGAHVASEAVDEIASDLAVAEAVPERGSNALTVIVPDRDGDGQPETIRYFWSGVSGDPLFRTFNDGPTVIVAQDVHEFDLEYCLETMGGTS
jgi:type II secretory pathway pseudopilin PulG